MVKKDYYEILGVPRDADLAAIKKAYRDIAIKYHPDRNPGDAKAEEFFKEASEAYQVLSDSDKRRTYDRFGHEGLRGAGYQGFSGFEDIFSSMGSIFEEIFGFSMGGRRRNGPARGSDLRYDLELKFEEAAFGVEKRIEVPRYANCLECHGTGIAKGKQPVVCPACQGSGQIRRTQGFFSISTPCGTCGGAGRIIKDPCLKCKGEGRIIEKIHVQVRIPPGVETGSRLRVPGKGEEGEKGGPPGDLYVFVQILLHEIFSREGNDVIIGINISIIEATLGTEVEIPTLDGMHKLTIPHGTQHGKIIKIKGKGIPHIRGYGRGDQLVEVKVRVPTNLTKRQEELLREFASIEGKKIKKPETILDKIKNFAAGDG